MIRLPKDAEGREIPLDTSELFLDDGTKVSVKGFEYKYRSSDSFGAWFVKPSEYLNLNTSDVHLDPPDSWERLLDDLDKAASKTSCGTCDYFGKNPTDCDTCAIGDITSCDSAAMRDIADRIRKLRGENDG